MFRLESVDRAEFLPASGQIIRLLVLDRGNVVLFVDTPLDFKLLHQRVMAVVIAQCDRRLFYLLTLEVFEKTFSCIFLRRKVFFVVFADIFDSFDGNHVLVVYSHAFKHLQVELELWVLPYSFQILLFLVFFFCWLLERHIVKIYHCLIIFCHEFRPIFIIFLFFSENWNLRVSRLLLRVCRFGFDIVGANIFKQVDISLTKCRTEHRRHKSAHLALV